MSDDLVEIARGSHGEAWYTDDTMKEPRLLQHVLADEITRLRAALATARREGMEEAARKIDCAMRELFGDADEYKQGWNDGLEAGAAAIRAAAGEGK